MRYQGVKKKWVQLFDKYLVGPMDEDGEVKGFCPYHHDRNPSASWNLQAEVLYCFSCQQGHQFYSIALDLSKGILHEPAGEDVQRALEAHAHKVSEDEPASLAEKPLTEDLVRSYHEDLFNNQGALKWLIGARGIDDNVIIDRQIGWEAATLRYTFPIRDESGVLVNLRRYTQTPRSGAPKMWNWPGCGSPARLYPIDNLQYDDLIITEGELDALICSQFGVPAISGTGGASMWRPEWNESFRGKNVCIIYDNDAAGRDGAKKAAMHLATVANSVSIGTVPLTHEGADISDLFTKHVGAFFNRDGLLQIVADAKPFLRPNLPAGSVEEEEILDAPLVSVEKSFDLTGKPVRVRGVVTSRESTPFQLPRLIEMRCAQDKGAICEFCPMAQEFGGSHDIEVSGATLDIVESVLDHRKDPKRTAKRMIGIPNDGKCDKVTVEFPEEQTMETFYVVDTLADSMDTSGDAERVVYHVGGHSTKVGEEIIVTGVSIPHPRNSQSVLVGRSTERMRSDFDEYRLTDKDAEELRSRYARTDGQRPMEKMEEIAKDLASRVTRIYGREDLHVAFDLVYHSVLKFRLPGANIERGFLDGLLFGHTRTGKTQVAKSLLSYYGDYGSMVSCENATVPGLMGAVENRGDGYRVKWGVIPMHDRRFLALDEMSGLVRGSGSYKKNLLQDMSSLRDEGVAKLNKAGAGKHAARVRKLFMSNPEGDESLAGKGSGIEAVRDLVGQPEDLSRFDFILGVFERSGGYSSAGYENAKRVCTPASAQKLALWAWSRDEDNVLWMDGAETKTREEATRLLEIYDSRIPLLDHGSAYVKIARLAVALAARTFSTDETNENILVYPEHVEDVANWLDKIYRVDQFGYYHFSEMEAARKRRASQYHERVFDGIRQFPALIAYLSEKAEYSTRGMVDAMMYRVGPSPTTASEDGTISFTMSAARADNFPAQLHSWGYLRVGRRTDSWTATPELEKLIDEIREAGHDS